MDNLKFNPLLYLYHSIEYPERLLYFLLHTFLPQYNFIINFQYCVFLWLYSVHCTENPIFVFPEMKLRSVVPIPIFMYL